MQLALFAGMGDRAICPDYLRLNGAGKGVEQPARPSLVCRIPLLPTPNSRADHPISGFEIGRQPSRNSETDDAQRAIDSRLQACDKLPRLAADDRYTWP